MHKFFTYGQQHGDAGIGTSGKISGSILPHGKYSRKRCKEYNISREDMDMFAFESHKKAAAAIAQGKFTDEIIPIVANRPGIDKNGRPTIETFTFSMDESVRPDISMEALAKLPPVFMAGGTVTAGTSSQKNDAAAFVVLMSKDKADEMGINPIAKFCGFAVQGLRPEIMGAGPIVAIPKVLNRLGMKLEDIDLFELNEAFACQVLASVRELGIDMDKLNVNGGGIALGHPLGATGAYLTIKLIEELKRRNKKNGIVTMCVGGGMGAAGVFKIL
jgi:acetyl-CoA acyltransferase